MTKKKRPHPGVEEVLARPFCYYCERDFDDLKILISHQKAKHFKCDKCGRRLNTAGGLSVHMNQVHKEALNSVENALPNRQGLDVEIFGMEGIPEDVIQSHNQRVLLQYYEEEADRRKATGNPAPGSRDENGAKKPKVESTLSLKERLAAHKAKKAAKEAGVSSGDVTPMGAGQGTAQSPGQSHSPAPFTGAGSPFPPNQPPFSAAPQASPPPSAFAPPFQPPPFQQSFQQPYGQQHPPFPQPGQGFGPPGGQFPGGFPGQQAGAPLFQPPYNGAGSPPMPYPNQQQRPPSMPSVAGLPQRPVFGGPPGNGYPPNMQQQPHEQISGIGSSVDDLISSVTNQTQAGATNGTPPTTEAPVERKPKKEKDKNSRLVFSDNETSPEEKMARLSRYAFTPNKKEETVLGNVTAEVTGIVAGPDDVVDKSS